MGVLSKFRVYAGELEVDPFRNALARTSPPSVVFLKGVDAHAPVCGSGAMNAKVEWVVIAVFRERSHTDPHFTLFLILYYDISDMVHRR